MIKFNEGEWLFSDYDNEIYYITQVCKCTYCEVRGFYEPCYISYSPTYGVSDDEITMNIHEAKGFKILKRTYDSSEDEFNVTCAINTSILNYSGTDNLSVHVYLLQ